jgi:hypothetical protein
MCDPQPPSYPFWLLIVKDFGPFILTPFAALLGFWFACRRDDRNITQSAKLKISFWRDQISSLRVHLAICSKHTESITALHEPVINAMVMFGAKRQTAIQKAWDDYRTLNPSRMRHETFTTIPTDMFSVESGTLGGPSEYAAILKSLDALRDALT